MTKNHLLCLLALATLISCGRKPQAKGVEAAIDPDTISVEKADTAESLPDTVYPSVKRYIKVKVRVIDSVTPGTIDSYADPYLNAPGILTFRGNHFRAMPCGRVEHAPTQIVTEWEFHTAIDERETDHGKWGGGTGWTGQPLYVEWPDSAVKRMKQHLAPDFSGREIIVGSLSSNLYFIDFMTGKASRPPIATGNPIKGTPSLDPSLCGSLYVGQGVAAERPFGALTVDLNSHSIRQVFPEDSLAPRRWGAYDSSPVRVGRFLIRPGENGVIYKYTVERGRLRLHSTMSYTAGWIAPGIESSMSVYRNYGFTADNHGYVVCTNLDNMRPVWVYATGDDNDASPVLAIEDGVPYLYCASEIDRQGDSPGNAVMVKLNALTGEPVWTTKFSGKRYEFNGKHFDGGFYATPLLGEGKSAHLLFANVVRNLNGQNGQFVAINRATGALFYELPLAIYSWSSPVGFLTPGGDMYAVTADGRGNVYLIDVLGGKVIDRRTVGSNFESSPVVVGNSLVVGSRGRSIYKLSIK